MNRKRLRERNAFSLCVFLVPLCAAASPARANELWPRPTIAPIPISEPGVRAPKVLLNGDWKFSAAPPSDFWNADASGWANADASGWANAAVPGDLSVQGLIDDRATNGKELAYRKVVTVPADFAGRKILLRIEGGYDYARIWVNGRFVRDHYGAFTTWDSDITPYVTPGQPARITVGLTAGPEETLGIEYRHTRGLVRDVSLLAAPKDHLTRLQCDTDFDDAYQNATLKVDAGMEFGAAPGATVRLSLTDPRGRKVTIGPSKIVLSPRAPEQSIRIPTTSPQKWDSEHPNLYRLTAQVKIDGRVVETITKSIGFRKIAWRGNQMFVNGQPVKLHGVNWHQDLANAGEIANAANDKASLDMIKSANVNFIRTSHYPQTEFVLDYCDKIGLYVEEETSIFFITEQGVAMNSESNPDFQPKYMNQFAEMIERDRSHPSIVMWSLGNESRWGSNMQHQFDYVKLEDPTRPTIWSYPDDHDAGTTPRFDIRSIHYPGQGWAFGQAAQPELCDEYSHILVTSSAAELRRDAGARDFYGEELKFWWEKMYAAPGNLGGAIWYAQDTTFARADGTFNPSLTAEWGVIDVWNRPKPEYWNVKKEYSPVVIDGNAKSVANPGAGKPLALPVQNRYNHSNLNEVTFAWKAGDGSGKMRGPNVAPGGQIGVIEIPARDWKNGDIVNIKVFRDKEYVDEYNFTLGIPHPIFPAAQGPAPTVTTDAKTIQITGRDFSLSFDQSTGSLTHGKFRGAEIITGGPYLNLGLPELKPWTLTSLDSRVSGDLTHIDISGKYGDLPVRFDVAVDAAGLIATTYTIDGAPPAEATEVGVAYTVSRNADRLTYRRSGTWSAYPADYIAGSEGVSLKTKPHGVDTWRVKPSWPWALDEKDFINDGAAKASAGRGTNAFRSSKTNVYHASLVLAGSNLRLRMEGDGTGSAHPLIEPNGDIRFNMNNQWSFKLSGGSMATQIRRDVTAGAGYTNTVRMRLTDGDDYGMGYEAIVK
ncbi:hypothetical protein CCAX7_10630 [Capsulimonas corticalis]|uniref:beta-galactosidase n=1 Tax=Capsulimonas corticalis TaxID=2219043 RepID=A0A402CUL1_9BACT|nr:glycoside hydrolase family 2 TIM barrel-domain containing protein [Capsulimonas corticalis]BDI29012.1 hypothetical protein CCAX7_10630 [Capsulimonas corticalis]